MRAALKNYRQTPRKVRLLADMIRGKKVQEALNALSFTNKRASEPLEKLIRSAIANAKQKGADESKLFIKEIMVDKGITFHRAIPRAFSRATPIRKTTSRVRMVLGEEGGAASSK